MIYDPERLKYNHTDWSKYTRHDNPSFFKYDSHRFERDPRIERPRAASVFDEAQRLLEKHSVECTAGTVARRIQQDGIEVEVDVRRSYTKRVVKPFALRMSGQAIVVRTPFARVKASNIDLDRAMTHTMNGIDFLLNEEDAEAADELLTWETALCSPTIDSESESPYNIDFLEYADQMRRLEGLILEQWIDHAARRCREYDFNGAIHFIMNNSGLWYEGEVTGPMKELWRDHTFKSCIRQARLAPLEIERAERHSPDSSPQTVLWNSDTVRIGRRRRMEDGSAFQPTFKRLTSGGLVDDPGRTKVEAGDVVSLAARVNMESVRHVDRYIGLTLELTGDIITADESILSGERPAQSARVL